jgi:uncharacterized membrane protein (UPF0127 family)
MKKISVEIADTPTLRSTGLMHRKKLAEDSGMLFKFPRPDYLDFWMRSTYIPLDIAFLENDGTIFQIAEMYPLSTRRISSKKPCKYALEVNHGWFEKNDLGVGDKIAGTDLAERQSRLAQSTIGNPNFPVNQDVLQNPPIPEEIPEDPEQEAEELEQQPSPRAEMVLDDHAKVRYAEKGNLAMQIVYESKQSGQTLPPRKLVPVPGEGYPIRVGEGGEYFVAFDASPTINGGEWQILGNQIKRFLFSNIIALEVLEFAE